MSDPWLEDLRRYRLIDLTTFRQNGQPVSTPVRYAVDGDRVVVSLQSRSGKVKRAKTNPTVTVRGHPTGLQRQGTLTLLSGERARAANRVLRQRHRLLFLQRLILGRHPRRHTTAEITFVPPARNPLIAHLPHVNRPTTTSDRCGSGGVGHRSGGV